MSKNKIKSRLLFLIIPILFISFFHACRPTTVPYSIVRESDFRVGPVDLPLTESGKKTLEQFLIKGGDKSKNSYIDPDAPKKYADLFKLISNQEFLFSNKFRKEGKIGTISNLLEKWFDKTIVYSTIDATIERPQIISPISLKTKDGKYWWIFMRDQDPAPNGQDIKIIKLIISLRPEFTPQQYGKIK